MKEYPPITGMITDALIGRKVFCFDKLDGSNIRGEFDRKKGWTKFGSRTRLLDETDPILGEAIPLFLNTYGEPLAKIITDHREFRGRQKAICFFEFYGEQSFAGTHYKDDPKKVTLFDVNIHQLGIIDPKRFIDIFGHLGIPQVFYEGNLYRDLVEDIKNGIYPIKEGMILKGGNGHNLFMVKVKTKAYLEKLKNTFKENWEQFI